MLHAVQYVQHRRLHPWCTAAWQVYKMLCELGIPTAKHVIVERNKENREPDDVVDECAATRHSTMRLGSIARRIVHPAAMRAEAFVHAARMGHAARSCAAH
jgi:hypothetical protein